MDCSSKVVMYICNIWPHYVTNRPCRAFRKKLFSIRSAFPRGLYPIYDLTTSCELYYFYMLYTILHIHVRHKAGCMLYVHANSVYENILMRDNSIHWGLVMQICVGKQVLVVGITKPCLVSMLPFCQTPITFEYICKIRSFRLGLMCVMQNDRNHSLTEMFPKYKYQIPPFTCL